MASIALSYICMGVIKYRASLNRRADDDQPRDTRVPNHSAMVLVSGVREVASVRGTCSLNVLFSIKKLDIEYGLEESRALTISTHRMNHRGHLAGSQMFHIGPVGHLNFGQ